MATTPEESARRNAAWRGSAKNRIRQLGLEIMQAGAEAGREGKTAAELAIEYEELMKRLDPEFEKAYAELQAEGEKPTN
jgi:hypothetical protein